MLTLAAVAGAALHVSAHVKTEPAPLHPAVLGATAASGRLSLSPSIRSAGVDTVTSTYAS